MCNLSLSHCIDCRGCSQAFIENHFAPNGSAYKNLHLLVECFLWLSKRLPLTVLLYIPLSPKKSERLTIHYTFAGPSQAYFKNLFLKLMPKMIIVCCIVWAPAGLKVIHGGIRNSKAINGLGHVEYADRHEG